MEGLVDLLEDVEGFSLLLTARGDGWAEDEGRKRVGEVERAVLVELPAKAPCCGRTDDQEDEELAGKIPDRHGRSWSVKVEAWGVGVEGG